MKVISQGKYIGGSPSNSAKGDTKDCSLRRDEPEHICSFSRVPAEPCRSSLCSAAQCLISREQLYIRTPYRAIFVLQTHVINIIRYPSLILQLCLAHEQFQDCPDLCFAHKQSQDRAANPWLYHKPGIQGLHRTIPRLRKSTLCA